MNRADAKRATARSRSYGWFRDSLTALSGYRTCPLCRTQIRGFGHGGDNMLARTVNDAIDTAMVDHLVFDNCTGGPR